MHGDRGLVLRSYRAWTVENSAPHLLPHLKSGQKVLDIGSGPGSITADIAGRVAPGEVIGVDKCSMTIQEATVEFGDVARFKVGDVYAHQVLQHLDRPIYALREMRRVTRPNGMIAVRDDDYAASAWAPVNDGMTRWMNLSQNVSKAVGHIPNADRHVLAWVRESGLVHPSVTSSNWTFADPISRQRGQLFGPQRPPIRLPRACFRPGAS